ncbi:MAG: hypothetical protein ABFD94_15770 [Armatimonadia bacterium]
MTKTCGVLAWFLLLSLAVAEQQPEAANAIKDLAGRLGVPAEQIQVGSLQETTWPDTSLGCAQPGMMYAQVLVPGYRILLRVGGQEFEYHSDRKGRAVYCSRNVVSGAEIPPVVERARADLASRLRCTKTEIAVVEAPYVEWPSAMFQQAEEVRVPVQTTPGYRPVFRCDDKEYAYRTDLLEEARFVQELPAGVSEAYRIAYLQPSERPSGSNLWDLQVRNSVTGQVATAVHNVVDFSMGPCPHRALVIRRAASSLYALSDADNPNVPIITAADFRGLSWSPDGSRYAVWAREQTKGSWRLLVAEPRQQPRVYNLDGQKLGSALPGLVQWQDGNMAFTFDDGKQARSFIVDLEGQIMPLPSGRFGGWLNEPGHFLRLEGDQLLTAGIDPVGQGAAVSTIRGLAWARVLPDGAGYVALSQEDDNVRVWQGPIEGRQAPRLVTELSGKLVQAQLSQRGRLLMVQQIGQTPDRRGECKVTMVQLQTGEQEPLGGVCVRAQLLPME